MGLRDIFRRKALTASPAVLEGLQNRQVSPYPPLGGINYNSSVVNAYQRGLDCTYGWMYRTQPAVRSVVDLIATNAAQLPLKLYERVSDTERERREDHPAAQLLADPDGRTPSDAFIRRIFLDYLIYDNAYVLKMTGRTGQRVLIRLMPQYISVYGGRFTPDGYVIWRPDGTGMNVQPENMMHWFGYDPDDPLKGLSKLDTLRLELAQDQAMQETMVQLAKHGLKGGYIWRPGDAPEWSHEDAERFAEQWNAAKQRTDGREAVLDEGMEYREVGVSPKDAEVVPSREFTKQEVADAYGLPMKALMEGDADARKAFYADVLPSLTQGFTCQLDVDILRAEFDEPDFYFSLDITAKLRGDPIERYAAITQAVGAPWMSRQEARALEDLSDLGDYTSRLILPLNVIEESENSPALPAPNVMPIQDPNKPPQDGSYRENATIENGNRLVKAVEGGTVPPENRIPQYSERRKQDIARQRRNITEGQALFARWYGRLGRVANQKAIDWGRYQREFDADILKYAVSLGEREGGIYLAHLAGGNFDLGQIRHWIEAMAAGTAEAFTKSFREDVDDLGVTQALERANNLKAALAGASVGTRLTVKVRQEAAMQSPGAEHRLQYWIADTDRHSDLDGVAVPLGSDWGGISPGSEPNCQCSVTIT